MNGTLYEKAEKFVVDSFTSAARIGGIRHFKRTVFWLKELKPDADEALLISGIAHDIERAFKSGTSSEIEKSNQGFIDQEYLAYHQEKGAAIIADFLHDQNADLTLIERVKMLVSKHENGGNDDQNILKDADSVSYFENQIDNFISYFVPKLGKEKVKEKFDWMYNRITSAKAKEIARPMYEAALEKLNNTDGN